MPNPDPKFEKQLRATFNVEAQEHVQVITSRLLELEKAPPSGAAPSAIVELVYREAHSLKGAARSVDLRDVEAICQAMEGVFSGWRHGLSQPSRDAFDALHQGLDRVQVILDAGGTGADAGAARQQEDVLWRLGRLAGQTGRNPEPSHTQRPPAVPAAPRGEPGVPLSPRPPEHSLAANPGTMEGPPGPVDSVRIAASKLDTALLQAEDMLGVKEIAARQARELRGLIARFDEWHRQWAKISSGVRSLRQGAAGTPPGTAGPIGPLLDFADWNADCVKAIEARLALLSAQAEQDRHGIGGRVDQLLEDAKRLLMLPFATAAGVFPKVVRDLCRDQGKEAELTVHGGEVEIDKRILEEMKDALTHVLRNCVDHGVEPPADRLRAGKRAAATVTLAVSQPAANRVEILVTDDGAGVDLVRVKESAVRNGIVSAAEADSLSHEASLALVFHPDVSASRAVTTISGRGLGMAIVRSKATRLGGHVVLESRAGAGTTLRITLPQTKATFRGLLVTAADRPFVVPMASLERVLRVRPADVRTVANREVIAVDGRSVSLVRLDAVLGLPRRRPTDEQDRAAMIYVAVVRGGDQRIALAVDEIRHEEEVLVKALPKPLARVRNISGAAILSTGRTTPVLNVADLVRSAAAPIAPPPAAAPDNRASRAKAKKVLVAEDSITSRMLLKGILESAGYRVVTAVDGLDALRALREEPFDLLVSDVEMPRLNGLDLTAGIRADPRLRDLPVILVTALESRTERERGVDAGASAYIVKSSFDQSNLLEVAERLV